MEVFADLLIWCASESGSENWAQNFVTEGETNNVDVLPVTFGCDYGFRLGIGYFMCHDGWDFLASYTWYKTSGKDSIQSEGEVTSSFLGNFYINNTDGTSLGPSYRGASIDWKIAFNMLDGELGMHCCVSPCFSLRPHAGIKGGWINQSIDSTWSDPTEPTLTFTSASEDLTNDFWGVGPTGGLDLDWILFTPGCQTISLFNEFSGAIMYGHWDFKDQYKTDEGEKIGIKVDSIDGAATMARDYVGLSWRWDGGCYSFALRVGYEAQIWLRQLQFYSLNYGRLDNVLTLQGGSIDFRFGF